MNVADRTYGIGRGLCGVAPDPHLIDQRFAWWTLQVTRRGLEPLAVGSTYDAVSAAVVGNLAQPVPSIDEQHAIAAFLDRETQRIDALVAKQQRLIERLQEYRTALITRTVTRGLPPEAARAAGLNPSPPLKPSGVEWLGDVPEHWDILPTKHAGRVVMGQSPPSDVYQDEPVERPFLQGNAEFGLSRPTPKWFCNAAPKVVHAGTVLLSVRAPVGALNLADRTYGIGRGLCGIAPDPQRLSQRFAWWALHITRQALSPLAVGSTYDAVSAAEVGNLKQPVPPLDEQHAIAAYLDHQTERIDALSEKAETAIDRLQEYRTALITTAVTGKIDVRDAAGEPVTATST